jgi:hypothetical protein
VTFPAGSQKHGGSQLRVRRNGGRGPATLAAAQLTPCLRRSARGSIRPDSESGCADRRPRRSVFVSPPLAATFQYGNVAGEGAGHCTRGRVRSPKKEEPCRDAPHWRRSLTAATGAGIRWFRTSMLAPFSGARCPGLPRHRTGGRCLPADHADERR